MDMGPCPTIQQTKPALAVSDEVGYRVSMLEANTGRVLPEDKAAALAGLDISQVNAFFFENAVHDVSVEGWSQYKLRLKGEQSPVSQWSVDHAHRNMMTYARRLSAYTKVYAQTLANHRKWLTGRVDVVDASELQPAVDAGYLIKEISATKVVLATPKIIIQYKGYKYDMGRYKVVIERGVIRVVQYSGGGAALGSLYRHPHVTPQGSVCWGTAHSVYTEFIQTGNPNEALIALLSVLRTYGGNPYKNIAYWVERLVGESVATLPVPDSELRGTVLERVPEGGEQTGIDLEYPEHTDYNRAYSLYKNGSYELIGYYSLMLDSSGKLTWCEYTRVEQ